MGNNLEALGYRRIEPENIISEQINPFQMIGKDWMLVTAGDENGWNTMTASWGFMGVMWGKNVATTVIRPQRYTREFADKADYFTLSFFGEDMRKALSYCGSHSGRDVNKAEETGLTPVFVDGTTTFEQAETVIVCKKLYVQEMTPESFEDNTIDEKWYAEKDYHIQYIGEIKSVYVKD